MEEQRGPGAERELELPRQKKPEDVAADSAVSW
jgi:hypothetical protein